MEEICTGFFPTPISNCETFSPYISIESSDLCGLDVRKPSSLSFLGQDSLKINGRIDCETQKVHSSFISGPVTEKGGETGKKSIRKYTERQRRKDMKELYSLLRSLLPEEYVLGKCTIADQLSGTTSYMNDLRQKVKELTQQRDEIREAELCENIPLSASSKTFPAVEIHSAGSGVLVTTSTFNCQILLSDLLLTLENNGLDIINASSTVVNDKQVSTIHAKVSYVRGFESTSLYRKVWNLVGGNSSVTNAVQSQYINDFFLIQLVITASEKVYNIKESSEPHPRWRAFNSSHVL